MVSERSVTIRRHRTPITSTFTVKERLTVSCLPADLKKNKQVTGHKKARVYMGQNSLSSQPFHFDLLESTQS